MQSRSFFPSNKLFDYLNRSLISLYNPVVKRKIVIVFCFIIFSGSSTIYSQCLKDIVDTKPVTITALTENVLFPAINAFDNADDAFGGWSASHDPEPGNECWLQINFNNGPEI